MTTQNPNVRESLNNGVLQQLADLGRQFKVGDLLGALIRDMANTQTGIVPASNVATLSAQPSSIFDLVSTAGTYTGRLSLLIGDASVPTRSGYAIWAGGTTLRLHAGDAITALDAKYARADAANVVTSGLERTLGQRD